MRNKRVWLAVVAAVVIVLVGGGVGWTMWTHSPTYSLARIAEAVERRDRYQFERHVDLDALLTSYVSDMAEGNPLVSAIGGAMTSKLRQDILRMVEEGKVDETSPVGRGLRGATSRELALEREGRNAYFQVAVKTSGGAPFSLRLHMTQVPDGYWRIDRIANVKQLREAEAAEEAAKKAEKARVVQERLRKLEVVAKLHTSVAEGWSRKNRFQVRLRNAGSDEIASFKGRIKVARAGFDEGIRGEIHLKPGATENGVWEFRVNQFMEETEKLYALGETEDVDFHVDSLALADGTEVKREE